MKRRKKRPRPVTTSRLAVVAAVNQSVAAAFDATRIPTVFRRHYRVQRGYTITGAAPKQFVRLWEPGCPHTKVRRWPLYIAKSAEKWYPTECVTELVMNRLGQCLGLPMAPSRLVWAEGQVRFLSRYFLRARTEELLHGANILAAYHNHDHELIAWIEAEGHERELVTVQAMCTALKAVFPADHAHLTAAFVRLLLFDALVGNYDRHFWNYGVIRDLTGQRPPRFAPIYDTARGLFWNEPEAKLLARVADRHQRDSYLRRYVEKSQPKVGWAGEAKLSHFKLVALLSEHEIGLNREAIQRFYTQVDLPTCLAMLDREFTGLLSPERLTLMKQCLTARLHRLLETVC